MKNRELDTLQEINRDGDENVCGEKSDGDNTCWPDITTPREDFHRVYFHVF